MPKITITIHAGRYDATRMAIVHAPTGGVTVGGKQFKGGEFIPGDVLAKATKAAKGVIDFVRQKSTFKVAQPSGFINPEKIEPINEIENESKFRKLVQQLISGLWNGPPVLAFNTGQGHEAITGSNRILAAREADIDLPVFELVPDDLEVELSDGSKLGETLFDVFDDEKLRLLRDASEADPDNENITTAVGLMEFEVDHNA